MSGTILSAAWIPGLPHLLSSERSPKWAELKRGCETLAQGISEVKPDVLVVYSTQWFSVLGTSFQAHPHPKGLHVDENWYELGDLPFDFKTDAALSTALAKAVQGPGMPTKTVNYGEFPIDTGTIVAMRLLNPEGKIPVSIVSSWVYADAEKSAALGRLMRAEIERSGKRAVLVASSSLSTRFFTDDIDPRQDKISASGDDEWNRRLLGLFEGGKLGEASKLAGEMARQVPVDMQLNAVHWLKGALGETTAPGRVIAYGPLWGTGAAAVEFRTEVKR
jgi:2-aminophenol/2-amino-5-chlorophenol 1,6-dioxygenase alpha subunit